MSPAAFADGAFTGFKLAYVELQAQAPQAEEEEGSVAYPSLAGVAAGKKGAKKSGGNGGGQVRAEDLPSAPPIPSTAAGQQADHERAPAMHV